MFQRKEMCSINEGAGLKETVDVVGIGCFCKKIIVKVISWREKKVVARIFVR